MSDQRPQYGEYASPEEQRRLAGLPPIETVQADVVPSVAVAPPLAPASPSAASAAPRPVDRLVTIALLAFGLVNVIATALSYLDLPRVMNDTMKLLEIDGEFTNFAQGRLWGTIAAIVLVVGWALTAAIAVRRIRRGRLSWWVPLVGAVVTLILASLCTAVPMMGDPAFNAHLDALAGR